jgi:hypothetical protein
MSNLISAVGAVGWAASGTLEYAFKLRALRISLAPLWSLRALNTWFGIRLLRVLGS